MTTRAPAHVARLLPVNDSRALPAAGEPAERADARRNRLRILRAAEELIADRGLEQIRMEDIAARAGVAKGTVFQRFGNRAGLAVALLDELERELQDAILSGPPPLGPGAPADERLVAFLDALVEFTDANLELLIVSDHDAPGGRYRTGAYAFLRLHASALLKELGFGERADGLSDTLLAAVSADLVRHRRAELHHSLAQIKDEIGLLARALTRSGSTRT
jgi:AcrR family transcriptional regulator